MRIPVRFPRDLSPLPKSDLDSAPCKTYVKGFLIDYGKICKLLNVEDVEDPKVHQVVYVIMKDFVERDKDWLCSALTLEDGKEVGVISLGEGSLGNDVEELRRKDLPISEYLTNMTSALTGPDVFEFLGW
jgi:hypothetical protein